MSGIEKEKQPPSGVDRHTEGSKMSGREFRAFTRFLGYNSTTFAREFGINRRTVARWERDELKIPDTIIERIYDSFDSIRQYARKLSAMTFVEREGRLVGADRDEQIAYSMIEVLSPRA